MANVVKLKRGSGSDPSASDMVVGEPVIRTDTAELFFKKDDGSVAKVSGGGGGPDFKYLALRNAANNGAASYPNADFTLVTSGTTNAITVAAANTLLVSVNGVIQKPNTGTSTPSSGFALSGTTIKFGGNISAAPDFILYQESGGIGEPSDETVSEAKLQVSNSPVNGYFLSAQSGNTGGLTWAAPVATSCTGNSATATALATARAINGVNFDGTAAITVTAAAGTLSGNTLNSSVVTSSLTSLGDLASLTVTGDLVVDTSTLKVDSSNNRVGIGTSSPEGKLHLETGSSGSSYSADNSDVLIIEHSDSVGIDLRSPAANSGNILFSDANARGQGRIGYGHNDDGMFFCTGGLANTRMTIDSSGKVGIGTSSPNQLLEVANSSGGATISISTDEQAGSQASKKYNNLDFTGYNNTVMARIQSWDESSSTGHGYLTFFTNKNGVGFTEKLRIDPDGNVLPGTDSQYNIGSSSVRFANGYFDTLYGDGSNLTGVSAGATGGGSDEVFYENSTTVTTSYSITSNKNAMSAGPLSINSGAVVTVPSGSVWTIV